MSIPVETNRLTFAAGARLISILGDQAVRAISGAMAAVCAGDVIAHVACAVHVIHVPDVGH